MKNTANTTFQIIDLKTGDVLDSRIGKTDKTPFSLLTSLQSLKNKGLLVSLFKFTEGDKELTLVKG
jgi:hypothetical protein